MATCICHHLVVLLRCHPRLQVLDADRGFSKRAVHLNVAINLTAHEADRGPRELLPLSTVKQSIGLNILPRPGAIHRPAVYHIALHLPAFYLHRVHLI